MILLSDSLLGQCTVSHEELSEGQVVDQWISLQGKPKKRKVLRGELRVKLLKSVPTLDSFLFRVKQRLWSFGDFTITEENGKPVFSVQGSWPSNFYFKDMFGRQVTQIKVILIFFSYFHPPKLRKKNQDFFVYAIFRCEVYFLSSLVTIFTILAPKIL
jgi:hypothetical protein